MTARAQRLLLILMFLLPMSMGYLAIDNGASPPELYLDTNDQITLSNIAHITVDANDSIWSTDSATAENAVQLGSDTTATKFAVYDNSATIGTTTPLFEVQGDGTVLAAGSAIGGNPTYNDGESQTWGTGNEGSINYTTGTDFEIKSTTNIEYSVGASSTHEWQCNNITRASLDCSDGDIYITGNGGMEFADSAPLRIGTDGDVTATFTSPDWLIDFEVASTGIAFRDTSNAEILYVGEDGTTSVPDSMSMCFGTGNDMCITHTAPNTSITTTAGEFVIDVATSGNSFVIKESGATALYLAAASNLFVHAYGSQFQDDVQLRLGSAADGVIKWANASAAWMFDNTATTGATLFDLGTDTSATRFAVRNNSGTELFAVEGDGVVELGGTALEASQISYDVTTPGDGNDTLSGSGYGTFTNTVATSGALTAGTRVKVTAWIEVTSYTSGSVLAYFDVAGTDFAPANVGSGSSVALVFEAVAGGRDAGAMWALENNTGVNADTVTIPDLTASARTISLELNPGHASNTVELTSISIEETAP